MPKPTRKCPTCKEELDLDDFYQGDWRCKGCKNKYRREKRQKDNANKEDFALMLEMMEDMRMKNIYLEEELKSMKTKIKVLKSTKYMPTGKHEEEVARIAKKVAKKEIKKALKELESEGSEE